MIDTQPVFARKRQGYRLVQEHPCMKRFYKSVQVQMTEHGLQIQLDARPVRTPMRALLTIRSASLADHLATEWAAQGEEIRPDTMPITKLATTVIDLLPDRREPAISEIADYALTDMLCYRAAEPHDLAERQERLWQPWLDWSATALDAPLIATTAIEPLEQPAASLVALTNHVRALDDWRLVGVHAITKLLGSTVLALALNVDALDHQEAFDLAMLEELYEVEKWGVEEQQAKRHAELRRDLAAANTYLLAL